MDAATVTEPRPLTAEERATLDSLLARASFGDGPAVRIGEPYLALINLSVPRRGDKDRATDLVYAGETVYLTEAEARLFNRHGTRDGRQIAVLQKLTGPDGTGETPLAIPPRAVSGRLFRPAVPPPGSDQARPDPVGSSAIQYLAAEGVPEDAPARPDAAEMADHLRETVQQDAVDLPPRRQARQRG